MEYAYSIDHSEVILRETMVYDAANLDSGELLMLSQSSTEPGRGITAYNATPANSAVAALGLLVDKRYQSGGTVPSGTSHTTPSYGKVIINPGAVYRAEDTTTPLAITSTSTTTLTGPTNLAQNKGGNYAYFSAGSNAKGCLRRLASTTTGAAVLSAALKGNASSDGRMISPLAPLQNPHNLSADAKSIDGGNLQAAAYGTATRLVILQSYIDRDAGLEVLRPDTHGNVDDLDKVKGGAGPKFYYDILCRDHFFGTSPARA